MQIKISNLQRLHIQGINNVKSIWPNLLCVQSLTELRVTNCSDLEQLFPSIEETEHEFSTMKLPKLKCLELESLNQLTSLSYESHIRLPSLEILKVKSCDELTFVLDNKVYIVLLFLFLSKVTNYI